MSDLPAITAETGARDPELWLQLKAHEGLRLKPYRDSVGKLTVGVGRNLDDVGLREGEAMFLCFCDVAALEQALDARLPWWRGLDAARRAVVIDMAFNMGVEGLLGFGDTLAALKAGRFGDAAQAMLRSRWAGQVGPARRDPRADDPHGRELRAGWRTGLGRRVVTALAAALAFIVKHRAVALWAALVLAGVLVAGWATHRLDAGPLARAQDRAKAAEAQAAAAVAQTQLDTTAAAAVETARTTEAHAAAATGAASDVIARLPHAADPVDPAVLAEWGRAVDGLRDEAAAGRAPAAPAGGADPARPVPPT